MTSNTMQAQVIDAERIIYAYHTLTSKLYSFQVTEYFYGRRVAALQF